MSLRGDDRGVVVQVGAVILFGFVILAITMYQVQVVPDQNREIEFKHNERVQDQLLDVRSAIMTTAGGGGTRSVSVTLGTNYPSRTIFLNPSPPYGKLRTVGTTDDSINVTISNATATNPETADFWNGTNRSYSTGALVYEPFYHRYDTAPTTVYEHSLLTNQFDDAALAKTDQQLVDGDEITLVVLNGSLEESRTGGVSLDTKELSVSTQTIQVTNKSDNITLRLPTLLDESVWNESLAGEDNVTIDYQSYPDRRFNVLELTLDPGDYTLKMAKVGVGSETEEPSRSVDYITSQDTDKSVQTGETVSLTVEVRDRYNNPVPDRNVTFDSKDTLTNASTGPDGKVAFTYEAPDSPTTDHVTAWIDGNASAEERVLFTIDVNEPSGGGGGSGAYTIDWVDPSQDNDDAILSNCSDSNCTWDVGKDVDDRLDLTAALNETIGGLTVEFGVNNTTVAEVDPPNESTNNDGEASTDLIANSNGTVAVFAASGGDSDRIDVQVVNVSSVAGSPSFTDLSIQDDSSSQGNEFAEFTVDYSVDDPGNTFKNVTVAFENTDTGTSETSSSTSSPSGSIDYKSNPNKSYGDTYEITVQIYNTNGDVVFEQTYIETADGINDNGNVI